MGEVNQIVDHMKLEYFGVFDIRQFFRMFTKWYKETPYEKGGDYISEQHTSHGKCIEYFYYPWIKENDYVRIFMKLRILFTDVKKIPITVDGKRKLIDHGDVKITLDGFLEYDWESRWDGVPFNLFVRTLFIKFMGRPYSKMMEKRIIEDCYTLYDMFERFFNMYKSYKKIEKAPHFYYS